MLRRLSGSLPPIGEDAPQNCLWSKGIAYVELEVEDPLPLGDTSWEVQNRSPKTRTALSIRADVSKLEVAVHIHSRLHLETLVLPETSTWAPLVLVKP